MQQGRLACVAVALALVLAAAAALPSQAAAAPPTAAQRLVAKYAPVLMLRKQEDPPCNTTEEQYLPTAVDVVLGNPRVSLVQVIKRQTREITTAPTAADIAGLGDTYY